MKILSAEQVRLVDAHTIENEPIPSNELMERAALSFVEAFILEHTINESIAVVCGTGNNGGDGLAISRILLKKSFSITPYVVRVKNGGSDDFKANLLKLREKTSVSIITKSVEIPSFDNEDVVIDALFGSGLTRAVMGLYGEVITSINKAKCKVVSVDITSGLFMDIPMDPTANINIIKADATISFQLPKLAFFMPENHKYVGHVQFVDIGLDNNFIAEQESDYSTIDKNHIEAVLPERTKFAHKGTFGHGQLLGGSYGKMGSISLAAKAFLRSGAGLLTVTIPVAGMNIMQTLVPEAMVIDQPGDHSIESMNVAGKADVFGIGPGLGAKKETVNAFGEFLMENSKPLILDADALNIISEKREMLALLAAETIITPHLKEFERLTGASENHWQRIEKAREFARKWQLIVVLKGANTAVIDKSGSVQFNTTGNPGMATAGSGDVLLGIITSLRTQGLGAIDAATAGVYIHGRAGDLAAEEKGMTSLIASDIIANLPQVFIELSR